MNSVRLPATRPDPRLISSYGSCQDAGLIASLSGVKSGKTVLINKVIPNDNLIAVSGAAIRSAEMLWQRVTIGSWLASGVPGQVNLMR